MYNLTTMNCYRMEMAPTTSLTGVLILSPRKLVLVTWVATITILSPLFATWSKFLIATFSPVIFTLSRGTSFLINRTSPAVTSKFESLAIVLANVGSGTALTISCDGPGAGYGDCKSIWPLLSKALIVGSGTGIIP